MENYNERQREYVEKFGLGYISPSLEKKFVLIGLVCYLTYKARQKNQNATCLQILEALGNKFFIEKKLQERIAIVAEDFMYGCQEFSTFGIKPSEIINTLKKIMEDMLPF